MLTPIHKLQSYSEFNEIFIKRDDLLPFSFGGNKVRIAECFFRDMEATGGEVMVAYGSERSNLVRAIANIAASRGVPCYVVVPQDEDKRGQEAFNARLSDGMGAFFRRCARKDVKKTIEEVMDEITKTGVKPYYIFGNSDGTGNRSVPVQAYVDTYSEIDAYQNQENLTFDLIFLPTGTGMTQAGLLCGKRVMGGSSDIVGISIARTSERCRQEIQAYADAYMSSHGLFVSHDKGSIIVSDEYLAGGYGKYDRNIEQSIEKLMNNEGISSDPTYVGKGFYGMVEYLRAQQIQGAKVLFIHTGGMPLFFDWLGRGLQ